MTKVSLEEGDRYFVDTPKGRYTFYHTPSSSYPFCITGPFSGASYARFANAKKYFLQHIKNYPIYKT